MGSVGVVFDTNVIISAIGFEEKPELCLIHSIAGDFTIFTSEPLLDDLDRARDTIISQLPKPNAKNYYPLCAEQVRRLLPTGK